LSSLTKGGLELIKAPLKFNFWRAETDNDGGWKVPQKMGVWKNEGDNFELADFETKTDFFSELVKIVANYSFLKTNSTVQITYNIFPSGQISVNFFN